MLIEFHKYQGTGNDFVMIDNRSGFFPKDDVATVARLCDRRFGIGADGLILLEGMGAADFRMVYYNSDGNESSMCGNGGRCLVAFAAQLGLITDTAYFIATDGPHHARRSSDGIVSLQMKDVADVSVNKDYVFLDTGSPHHVEMVDDLRHLDVKSKGAAIRYSDLYGAKGSNVNFVAALGDGRFAVRTYERGVEDETLSCGTGATAVALAMYATGQTTAHRVGLEVEGGQLEVSFRPEGKGFKDVFLIGPAKFVFSGQIDI
ncbi:MULTISPECIES: diaminopimelate epimerase [unclassified Flavobacterium]|uniref:diaminopimelate epimerase n=1 Tax=unclassified Flavobacterium TaxID=196869 RepID=UPI001F137F41|nr:MULTISPECIES: diaminopimelate epimerase [unclassified Flavobacterium]UMY65802.1 diaminopimelate epimerase [Flavobacterium sp. HJ-32-4]